VFPSGNKVGFVNLVATDLLSITTVDKSKITLLPFKSAIQAAIIDAKKQHPDILTFILNSASANEYELKLLVSSVNEISVAVVPMRYPLHFYSLSLSPSLPLLKFQ
jgi:hypothetical protein